VTCSLGQGNSPQEILQCKKMRNNIQGESLGLEGVEKGIK
jgi:hypothetical protein